MKKLSYFVSVMLVAALTMGMQSCTTMADNPRSVEEPTTPDDPEPEPIVVDGTASWAVGNEAVAELTEGLEEVVEFTGVTVGEGLAVDEATYFESTMVKYTPLESNSGCVAGVMIEYTFKAVEGAEFLPTSISYDAVKVGTDNATYSWSFTVDGVESEQVKIDPKPDLLRNNGANSEENGGTAKLNHVEEITAEPGQVFTLRFYISDCADNKNICIGNVKINGVVTK